MADTPEVLILDDGELDDLVSLLKQLGVPFTRLRGGEIEYGIDDPAQPPNLPAGPVVRLIPRSVDPSSPHSLLATRRSQFPSPHPNRRFRGSTPPRSSPNTESRILSPQLIVNS